LDGTNRASGSLIDYEAMNMKLRGKLDKRRLGALLTILLVALSTFVYCDYTRASHALDDRLHGDADDAHGALDAVLASTPRDRQVSVVLRYVSDPNPGLRSAAIDALGDLRDPSTIDVLERGFQDNSAAVREGALYGVYGVNHMLGLRMFLAGLHDGDSGIREASAAALKTFGDKRLVGPLIDALGDPDHNVGLMVMGALRRFTGASYPGAERKDGTLSVTGAVFVPKTASTAAQYDLAVLSWRKWWRTNQAAWPTDPQFAHVAAVVPSHADPAPAFLISDIDGRPISLAAQSGRITVLNFWGTWCALCQVDLPGLTRMDREYRSRGVDVIGIALHETSSDSLRQWCRVHGILYRQALGVDSMLGDYGDINEVPVTIIIDGDGMIRYRWDGTVDYGTLKAAVDRILGEANAGNRMAGASS
jgi:cytochrome c biogenesis protein CcmG/thiol:disulfide interchange protein DsbE